MHTFVLGFVGSIFFLTLSGNYRLLVAFVGVSIIGLFRGTDFLQHLIIYVCGILMGVGSLLFFTTHHPTNNTNLQEGEMFKGTITGVRANGVYEVAYQDTISYLLRFPDYLSKPEINSQLYGIVGRVTAATPLKFSRSGDHRDRHSIITGEFSYERWLYMKGYGGELQLRDIITSPTSSRNSANTTNTTNTLAFLAPYQLRITLQEQIQKTYNDSKEGYLLQGMLIGGREGMSDEHYQMFIDSGLVHIIAVSGSNIMMLVVALRYLLFFIPLIIRRVFIGVCIIFYLFVCGFDSSILRATCMAILQLLVVFRGVKISFKRLLYYSVILLLIYNPYFLLFDLGFLLSIFALIGLRIGAKLTQELPNIIKHYLLPPIFAFLGVVPIIILFTGTVNLFSFITSVILGPLLSIILLLSTVILLYAPERLMDVTTFALHSIYKLAAYGQQFGVYLVVHDTIWSIGVVLLATVSCWIVIKTLRLQPHKLL